jgi:hypothetical protein
LPELAEGLVRPGARVKVGSGVYHILYLPSGWRPGGRYPVIVEYAGNGPYENATCPIAITMSRGFCGRVPLRAKLRLWAQEVLE